MKNAVSLTLHGIILWTVICWDGAHGMEENSPLKLKTVTEIKKIMAAAQSAVEMGRYAGGDSHRRARRSPESLFPRKLIQTEGMGEPEKIGESGEEPETKFEPGAPPPPEEIKFGGKPGQPEAGKTNITEEIPQPPDLIEYVGNFTFPKHLCDDIGTNCKKYPIYQCILKCAFLNSPILPFVALAPLATNIACLAANTIFTKLPKLIYKSKEAFGSIRQVLDSFAVPPGSESEFAWIGANSLFNSVIKFGKGVGLNLVKPAIEKLELHDADQRPVERSDLLGFNPILASGVKPNFNCKESDVEDETHLFAGAMEKRPCLMDLLMPGYFVFSRAPFQASSRLIKPLLRAWNMPLMLFTGVGCCLTKYTLDKKIYECENKPNYFPKEGHGLPRKTGPRSESVCGSIPQFVAGIRRIAVEKKLVDVTKNKTNPLLKGDNPPPILEGGNSTGNGSEPPPPPAPATSTGKPICNKSPGNDRVVMGAMGEEGEELEDCEPTTIRPDLVDYSVEVAYPDSGEILNEDFKTGEVASGDYPGEDEEFLHWEY